VARNGLAGSTAEASRDRLEAAALAWLSRLERELHESSRRAWDLIRQRLLVPITIRGLLAPVARRDGTPRDAHPRPSGHGMWALGSGFSVPMGSNIGGGCPAVHVVHRPRAATQS
jgi:hypothetical protein